MGGSAERACLAVTKVCSNSSVHVF